MTKNPLTTGKSFSGELSTGGELSQWQISKSKFLSGDTRALIFKSSLFSTHVLTFLSPSNLRDLCLPLETTKTILLIPSNAPTLSSWGLGRKRKLPPSVEHSRFQYRAPTDAIPTHWFIMGDTLVEPYTQCVTSKHC